MNPGLHSSFLELFQAVLSCLAVSRASLNAMKLSDMLDVPFGRRTREIFPDKAD